MHCFVFDNVLEFTVEWRKCKYQTKKIITINKRTGDEYYIEKIKHEPREKYKARNTANTHKYVQSKKPMKLFTCQQVLH